MNTRIICIAVMLAVAFSCQKDESDLAAVPVSDAVLTQIGKLGFSTHDVKRLDDGYLVEGDIVLHSNAFSRGINKQILRIAESEQYRTTNLVTPRLIKISVASNLSDIFVAGTDEAISRYNAENLSITFQRVRSGADIQIVKSNFLEQNVFLASAGFPSDEGEPYYRIKVSTNQFGGQPLGTVASVLAHEIGHCIGFRHTDYMDRSYSCGGAFANEGESSVGAIQIPGTPSGPDAFSWMLSCINSQANRPFNANDKIALDYLY
jgi:hypothetical protein